VEHCFFKITSLSMFRILFFITFLASVVTGYAASFTIESAVTYAIAHNPDLAAARFSIEEARARLLGSGRLSNPELESGLRPNVRGREFSFGTGFVQRFPLTNRLRLEKALSQAEVATAEAEVMAAEVKLGSSLRSVVVKILSLEASRALKEKQIANSRELAATAAKIAASAEGSGLEATQFELEASQLSLDLLTLESERATLTGEARPLLGVPVSETVEFTGSLPDASLPSTASPHVGARADYLAAQARIDAARQGIALAKVNQWADAEVGLGGEFSQNDDAGYGLEKETLLGLKFSLPLPFWNNNEGKIQEAQAATARAEKEAEALAANVRAEAMAALGEMKAARRILDETATVLLPKARNLEEKIAAFYQQSQPGILLTDVLRSREKRLAIEQANLDALRAFHLARIRYQAAMGR
jgi:cobalt-zinc-cadmium efflux system outer membrane protein